MHYLTKRRVMLGMTTGGLLMTGLGMASAHADTTASGESKHSPGIGSGNLVQIPINAPINVCGNQVDVIGVGNTDHGNSCSNGGSGSTTASGSSKGSPGVGSGNVIQVPINAPVNVCGNQVDVIGILDSVTGNSCSNGGGSTTPPPPTPTPTQPTPPPTTCGCTPPPPPPPTTPCPPSGTTTATPTSSAPGTPSSTSTPSSTGSPTSTSPHGGPNGGSNGNGSSGTPTGVLAHTGSGALVVAPLGAGLIGGGVLLRKRFPSRSH